MQVSAAVRSRLDSTVRGSWPWRLGWWWACSTHYACAKQTINWRVSG